MRLAQNVCLEQISDDFENGSCLVKIRSVGQILEKLCVHSRGNNFSLIIIKLGHFTIVFQLYFTTSTSEISDEFENGLCQVKKRGH